MWTYENASVFICNPNEKKYTQQTKVLAPTLKQICCHFKEAFAAAFTGSYHNFRSRQWRKFRQLSDISLPVYHIDPVGIIHKGGPNGQNYLAYLF